MKRLEALAPLSREHHTSLILAQLLKKDAPAYKGLPETIEGKADYAQQQFEKEIKGHFEKEELMLGIAKDCNEAFSRLAEEIKKEHKELTALFLSLDTKINQANRMEELGRKLEDHIRKEERVLFPLLQQHCSADLLQQIHAVLH
ncbi:MAG: hemerythrin domain-containing protein [Chitinophagaceae bacterium]|nr:hemerythrin domain-containing protein [Chitinophagaceae bacterium]